MTAFTDGFWYKAKLELPAGTYRLATKTVHDVEGNWASGIKSIDELVRAIDEEKQYQPQTFKLTINYRIEYFRTMMAHATNGNIDRSQITLYTLDCDDTLISSRLARIVEWESGPNTFTLVCTDWNCGIDLSYPANFITEEEYPDSVEAARGEAVQPIWGRHAATFGALRAWRVRPNVFLAGSGELYNIDAAFETSGAPIGEEEYSFQYDSVDDKTYIYFNSTADFITFNCYGRVNTSGSYVDNPVDVLSEIMDAFSAQFPSDFSLTKDTTSFDDAKSMMSGRSYKSCVCLDGPESFRDIIETWAVCFEVNWLINDSEQLKLSLIDFDSYSVTRAFTRREIQALTGERGRPSDIVNNVKFYYKFSYVDRSFQRSPMYSKSVSISAHGEYFKELRLLFIGDDATALDVTQRYVARRHTTPRRVSFQVRPAAWRDGCSVGDIISVEHENLIQSGTQEYQVLRVTEADLEGRVSLTAISFDPTNNLIINSWAETGGSISPSGFTDVPKNGNQRYLITPAAGYSFNKANVDGIEYGDGEEGITNNGDGTFYYDFFNVTSNHTLFVTFTPDWTGVEVIATASAGGRINPSSTSGPLRYSLGSNETFILTPKNSYYPPDMGASLLDLKVKITDTTSWTTYVPGVDPELVAGDNGKYSFTLSNITQNMTLFARFNIP